MTERLHFHFSLLCIGEGNGNPLQCLENARDGVAQRQTQLKWLSSSRQHSKKQRHYFANKGLSGRGYGFSSGQVGMWQLDCEESWVPKNWCFWTVVLEKTLESPLDCKEIQPVHPKGDQSWVFIGRTDAEAETPTLWPPHVKSWLVGKDPDAGSDWGQEEKGTTDGWMASPTRWAWVWVNSGSWWRTGRPGVLRFMGSQRVGHNWATELNWTEIISLSFVTLEHKMQLFSIFKFHLFSSYHI